jgi:hypothetical protein
MPTRLPSDVIAYLVIEDFGELGRAFVETDLAQADRETIIRNFDYSGRSRERSIPPERRLRTGIRGRPRPRLRFC